MDADLARRARKNTLGVRSAQPLPVVARALVICSILAVGFAGTVTALTGTIEGVRPAVAATPPLALTVPEPVVQLVLPIPGIEEAKVEEEATAPTPATVEETIDAVAAAALPASDAAIDRAPYDALIEEVSLPGPADPEQVLTFGPMRIKRGLVETILRAARATETDPALLMAIADKESSFATAVEARTSSAAGLFQFIERTWLTVVRDFGARHGRLKEATEIATVDGDPVVADPETRARILSLRTDPYLATVLAAEMLKRDAGRIAARIGRELTVGETYLAHFLGPDDAERFIAQLAEKPGSVAARLLPRPARANRPIFFARKGKKAKGLSVAEVHRKFEDMMGRRLDRYRSVQELTGATAYAAVE
ncbi:transglycosylase SLT domain-containing protein [Chelatococcus sp. SYSU_G07232]|uniref:Transglycosylase SLT domain-containing protein n=1 Tax=Chelatococcus albus TaxID=3047466 RepID=A0ABT7AGB8_9HYPH|nr:transglycosylase SLT domain-containing protein [Chelatococcus sp. SYSU_G07232]MDJ1158417.1 transglycosylase SLT domain-containing protein [Chelatococcus sp. SYSU_G07232]